jgi:lysine 2-monooxygenase
MAATEHMRVENMTKLQASLSHPIFDVVIVGAGISGTYVAWRLLGSHRSSGSLQDPVSSAETRQPGSVALFEYSGRIGGRLWSQVIPGAEHLPVELGGMRFLSTHKRVHGLVKHLNLPVKPFLTADPRRTNLFYLRGKRFPAEAWRRTRFRPPYQLRTTERGKSPDELLVEVALKYKSRAASLYNQGFWNLLLQELSKEAYNLITDACGYYTIVNNWNAARAIPYLLVDFGPKVKYLALRDGFQRLPLRLAEQFEAAGGQIHRHHRLHRLDLAKLQEEPLIRLTFDVGDPAKFGFRRVTKGKVVYARSVVLAMPRRPIEQLHSDSFLFESEQFQSDLRTVLPQPAFKVFSAYREPWWARNPLNVGAGRSDTDLPLRQCYYWGTEGDQPGADKFNRNSVLMASYSDGAAVEYWAGLSRSQRVYRPRVEWSGGEPAKHETTKVPHQLIAPEVMVHEMQRQLKELHGLGDIPEPYETVYRDWTQDPFGGGWHFWKIHERAEDVMPRIQHPISGVKLYICGEAWSTQQGWVEGALETAESMLQRNFGLPAPRWM